MYIMQVNGEAEEVGTDGGKNWNVSVPRKILPSEIGQGGRAGGGDEEEEEEEYEIKGSLTDAGAEDSDGAKEDVEVEEEDGDWVWMWKARHKVRKELRLNHTAVLRRMRGKDYSDKALVAARVVLTSSDGFRSPHTTIHDVMMAADGTDDSIILRRGNHTVGARDEGDEVEGVHGPVDLHSCMTLEAEEEDLEEIDKEEDDAEDLDAVKEEETEENKEVKHQEQEQGDQGRHKGGRSSGKGRTKRGDGVWELGIKDTCLYTRQMWPLLVCYQPSADVRVVALKLLHGARMPIYDRRVKSKDSWTRCIHVTGGKVVFASCSVACLSGVGLLVEGGAARVQCVRSHFSESGVDGIAVLGGAQVRMETCKVSKNGASGLYVRGVGSQVLASGSRFFANAWQGAIAAQGAQLQVFNSWVYDNGQAGIAAFDQSSEARITNSDVIGNVHGVAAERQSKAFVSRCRLVDNVETGAFSQHAGSSLSVDTCQVQGNLLGVAVRDNGHILVVRSLLKNNKMHDAWNEPPGGRIDGVKEGGPMTEALDVESWTQSMMKRENRQEADERRRNKRQEGLGKGDSDEMELLPASEEMSTSLESI